ncbi:alpha/beta fold hydrolase [Pedobacter puniceum]|uniref:Alpha/beta fold hydrolase n=1 Tax=Pedobacter puniceum TaxID=2666136 RepID=A0A7K0FLX8_9SPHI|nr:alpha/beta hydrolase [Pedobacter puniceum]MRX46933.1 alpha/beta fold hydrolase [Pedobacter puniceum]
MKPAKKNNVRQLGNLEGATMIFAHGFGTDQSAWDQVIKAFISNYRIILFDNVGGGKADLESFSPNKYTSLQAYAEDLIAICEAYNVKDAILVGHSVSGMIGLLTAIKRPEFFSKLIMIGASPRYLNDTDYVGGFEQQGLNEIYETMTNNYFAWVSGFSVAAMANPENPQLAESFAATLKAIRPDIAQSVARVIFQSDYRKELQKLNKPTLLLQAKEDIAVPLSVAEYLHKNIKNSKLKVVNAFGHFPHMSAPQEIINEIKQFI